MMEQTVYGSTQVNLYMHFMTLNVDADISQLSAEFTDRVLPLSGHTAAVHAANRVD